MAEMEKLCPTFSSQQLVFYQKDLLPTSAGCQKFYANNIKNEFEADILQ
jgi:hypothetical protein